MYGYFVASADHLLSALFLGFVPVVVTCLLAGGLISVVTRSTDHLIYSLSFSVLGASLGLLLGASREPVVQAFLPAIITLISGVLVIVFPKLDAVKQLAHSLSKGDDQTAIRRFVLIGLAAMLLSSVTASFWGSSIRSVREQDDRRYSEWLEMYKNVRIPLELEAGRKRLELPAPSTSNDP